MINTENNCKDVLLTLSGVVIFILSVVFIRNVITNIQILYIEGLKEYVLKLKLKLNE